MAVITEITERVKDHSMTPTDKIIIGMVGFLCLLAIVFFVIIFRKVGEDKNAQSKERVQALEQQLKDSKDQVILLQKLDKEKDAKIEIYFQRDSALQQVVTNNNYLLRKISERDKKVIDRINDPKFDADSIRRAFAAQ